MKRNVALWLGSMSLLASHGLVVGCGDNEPNRSEDGSGGDGTTAGDGDGDGSGGKTTTGDGDGDGSGGKTTTGDGDGDGDGSGGKTTTGGNGNGDGDGDGDGGKGGEGGQGGQGNDDDGPVPGHNYLLNPGFEVGNAADKLAVIPGWQESGDLIASYLEADWPHSGAQRLTHWKLWEQAGDRIEVSTFQTVGNIPNGTYSFSIWVARAEWFDDQYLYVDGYADDAVEITQSTFDNWSASEYVKVEISGIEVTNNQITVGVYSAGTAGNGSWASFDDASLTGE